MKRSLPLTLLSILLFTGCAYKSHQELFIEKAKEQNINYKTLHAICKKESSLNVNVVNVNESIIDIQRGPHYFSSAWKANLYMDLVLDPLLLNYDVGICQINKQHLKRLKLDNEDLLDRETNIEIAAKIYRYNIKKCRGDIICALSMYNTGQKHSKRGIAYAKKVLKIRKRLYGE
jgi:soluble lytic murein transglycosylase-like protein